MINILFATALLAQPKLDLQEVYIPDSPGVMYRTSAALILVGADFPEQNAFQNSARQMRSTMVNDWKFPDQNVLVREVRTAEDVQRELRWLEASTTDEDRVIVAFISHGVDGSNGPDLDLGLGKGRFRMDDASSEFAKIKARHKLLILDACQSGGASAGPAAGLVTQGPEARSRKSSAIILTSDPGKDALIGATYTRFVGALLQESQRAGKDAAKRASRGMWLSDVVPGEQLGFVQFGSAERGASSQLLLDPLPIDRSALEAGAEFARFDPEQRAARENAVKKLRELLQSSNSVSMTEGEIAVRQLQLGVALSFEPDPTKRRQSLGEAIKLLDNMRGLPDQFQHDRKSALARAQQWLGELEGSQELLFRSVSEWNSVTQALSVDQNPSGWAVAQNNLGTTLQALGGLEQGVERLEEAVRAYRAALQVTPRDSAPANWAVIQNNLGLAHMSIGERGPGARQFERAVDAYRSALEVTTRDDSPGNWATIQSNLAGALAAIGEREGGTQRLEQAVASYQSALEVYTRQEAPNDWAMTLSNLGLALNLLGERESSVDRLNQAVSAYLSAMEVVTRESAPADWAIIQNNLGNVLSSIAEREPGTKRWEETVAAYRAALEVYTQEDTPADWAMTQYNLGLALQFLGERETGTQRLEEAVLAYLKALEVRTREASPYKWAITQTNLGSVYYLMATRADRKANLRTALKHLCLAEQGFQQVRDRANTEQAKEYMGVVERELKTIAQGGTS